MGRNTGKGVEGSRSVLRVRESIWEVFGDQKYLGVLLEDTTTESGLTNTWENVRDIVAQCTKRGQWLSDEEKRTMEMTLRPRFVAEDHQPRPRDTTTEKGIEVTAVEQILK